MKRASKPDSDEESSWYAQRTTGGLRVADALDEIKSFAYRAFDELDNDGDGFISRAELETVLAGRTLASRERSFVSFLLRRLEDIESAYNEEWTHGGEGISRADIQEYFKKILRKV